MTDKPIQPEQRVVFGVGTDQSGCMVLVLQVPPGGWDYMQDGTCHTFDLAKVGVDLKILLAGCKSRADGVKIIEQMQAAGGASSLHMPGTDFGIK